jgi:hypothetical protein
VDKYLKIVELTSLPASNPDDDLSFSRLILDKLSLALEQLGSMDDSDMVHLGTW